MSINQTIDDQLSALIQNLEYGLLSIPSKTEAADMVRKAWCDHQGQRIREIMVWHRIEALHQAKIWHKVREIHKGHNLNFPVD
tara:strand:- start:287 stop:535 length:249 start_codon:yes stop_codon:yes gene_type:complete